MRHMLISMRMVLSGIFFGLVLLWLTAAAHAETPLDVFFRPAPDCAAKLPPDTVYPQGRQFPYTLFSVGGSVKSEAEREAALSRVKADGFTLIGPQYELNDRVAADAKKHGLKAVYAVGLPMKFLSDTPLDLSPEAIAEGIREQVQEVAADSAIAWWYLQPEELRYWRKKEMTYLETAANAIREVDPLHRPIWMYDPGHRDADALAHTVKHLDLCGKGLYTNYSGRRTARVWVRWSIEQEVEAIAKANPSAVPIAVPEMFQQPDPEDLERICAWVRHDVYLSLITGAKGIVVFSMRQRENFEAHERYYQSYAQTAREISGSGGLGQVFLFGEKRSDIAVEVLEGPARLTLELKRGKETVAKDYPSISCLDVAYGAKRYCFAVNSANHPVRVRFSGLPEVGVLAKDAFGRRETFAVESGAYVVPFAPLEVKAWQFLPAEDGGARASS